MCRREVSHLRWFVGKGVLSPDFMLLPSYCLMAYWPRWMAELTEEESLIPAAIATVRIGVFLGPQILF